MKELTIEYYRYLGGKPYCGKYLRNEAAKNR